MSPPNVSKRVTFRQKCCQFVISFVGIHRQEIIEALDVYLQLTSISPESESGTGAEPGPSSGPFIDGLTQRLESALDDLLAAERRHLNERDNDAELRRRRDHAAVALRQDLFHVRQLLRGAYSQLQTENLGFERRIAEDPVPLLRQAARIEDHLMADQMSAPTPHFPGIELDFGILAQALRKRRTDLQKALDDVTRDVGRLQRPQVEKDRALKNLDNTYRRVVRCLIEAFRMAGWDELAARIPRSPVYRSGRTSSGPR